ncbi:flagellar biosynthesis protein FlaG [Sporosarcina sp. P26b]|uniref:flagellar protein FlaG n=1 Tax=unclassified Sporosarcina TaxID=2647733 RepID=UPI000C16A411|nr:MULTISPECIES: flagellar protein FlaG [unclassified Sporosarcina]PIC73006.1 flagellar biosynthesis protein FlaG [Sporosarcina sp. P17b]PIC95232.1 flagellar biosynthesis protein FlaG [Sporosarcina sp. P26b]
MVSRIGDGPATQPVKSSYESGSVENKIVVANIQPMGQPAEQATPEQKAELSKSEAKKLTEGMNKFLDSVNVQLRFKFHEKLNEYYVTIIDPETEEVIREIPPKKLLDIHAAMKDFIGLLIDKKI